MISGSFEEEDAKDLASVLRFGALPLELETQQTRTVSATIGDDVLRAGVIAGLIGLAVVAVYLLAYYRLAGLVALGGLVISAVLLWGDHRLVRREPGSCPDPGRCRGLDRVDRRPPPTPTSCTSRT